MATQIFDSGSGPSRDDRAWVLCDNNDVTLPSYGDRSAILKTLRGLPTVLSAIFENPQGIKVTGAQAETDPVSGSYYGWPAGMSVDYAGGTIYAGTYAGVQDSPFGPYYPRPDQRGQYIIDTVEVSSDSSGITLKASWGMGSNNNISIGGADTVANLVWFERTYSYTITVKWYDSTDTLISTSTATDTITSPSIADEWTEVETYGPDHFFSRPTNAASVNYGIVVTSFSPAIDI